MTPPSSFRNDRSGGAATPCRRAGTRAAHLVFAMGQLAKLRADRRSASALVRDVRSSFRNDRSSGAATRCRRAGTRLLIPNSVEIPIAVRSPLVYLRRQHPELFRDAQSNEHFRIWERKPTFRDLYSDRSRSVVSVTPRQKDSAIPALSCRYHRLQYDQGS